MISPFVLGMTLFSPACIDPLHDKARLESAPAGYDTDEDADSPVQAEDSADSDFAEGDSEPATGDTEAIDTAVEDSDVACTRYDDLLAVHAADLNHDLLADLVYIHHGGDWCVSLNGTATFPEPTDLWMQTDLSNSTAWGTLVDDVNGDGRADALWGPKDDSGVYTGTLYLALARGQDFAPVSSESVLPDPMFSGVQPCEDEDWVTMDRFEVVDVDMDGVGELITQDVQSECYVAHEFDGAVFTDPQVWFTGQGIESTLLVRGDMDGNGCEEIGAFYVYNGKNSYTDARWKIVGPANQDGLLCSPISVPKESSKPYWNTWALSFGSGATRIFLEDVNNDAMADAIWTDSAGQWSVALNTGVVSTGFDVTSGAVITLPGGADFAVVGDFDGDGGSDAGQLDVGEQSWCFALGSGSGFSTCVKSF